ncbi:CDP-diacylglycerol--glycerol-3-phosphate 3-phosphatidyltransferase [Propionicimonas sp.]|uniref:CDP-diacylglycerol--glycerol-3-phosphate 3-phosphatidyltransferase n=1 Tax=Propionicimonas sp. TaxID=1955623 RepID=UPI0017BFB090|nr:CDP-diacylglycerol--glycerol-3-phosphate 3-phosphatidyltransferase [Propionicimonas sp.]MBU3977225.1 CDP-diacylglycerol--glycerol-3-phosphate 3-phosphatidyltransferase [Actinomycetota bacterium]MBA3021151.1 CDP-diacylglycerol--glycerol-3-phosphate 3-phosphatidyltransferase [Propionicimonas sp.]MBU3985735.1 CDP-diacylglycerol--glycerol-3-phosphate 3-phosphatidyltransferase [Actinomycetota bacterium]MBU4008520.1 CDP-diacylglycerol--glycerol-3-phosphate 3-phosphatidyltransferase [Actinomycetota
MSQDIPPVKPPIPAQLPNALTVLRLVLVPVFVVLMFVEPGVGFGWRLAGTAAFGLAILTDYFDGMLARKYGLVSDFGKIWDPIADKALTGAAFIVLSVFGELPWWITVLILAREWGITWMRVVMLKYAVMAAAPAGKLKTVTQAIALLIFLPYPIGQAAPFWFWLGWLVMGAAFALTVITGVMYVFDALRLRRQSNAEPKSDAS